MGMGYDDEFSSSAGNLYLSNSNVIYRFDWEHLHVPAARHHRGDARSGELLQKIAARILRIERERGHVSG